MRIALLHTGQIHVASFEALFKAQGFEGDVTHRVEEGLLNAARANGVQSVAAEAHGILESLTDADAVLCTCSTIGPLVDDVIARHGHVLRIDRPAMAQAIGHGATPMVAICLESTRQPTLDLLGDVARDLGEAITPKTLMCADAWPHFESGDLDEFAEVIAANISDAVAADDTINCVLLAQASMQVAKPKLSHLSIPVLTTPDPAVALAIETARRG